MLISPAARPGGHVQNKGRFLLGLLTPVKGNQEPRVISFPRAKTMGDLWIKD